jgi:hypothetical protein
MERSGIPVRFILLFGAVYLMREGGVEGSQRYCSAMGHSAPHLCTNHRDDFCDYLLQFRWLQDPRTVQNDV